jgi:hypothetical protein
LSYARKNANSGKNRMSPIDPSFPNPHENDIKVDRANAFLLYAAFCGDVVRTAAALGVTSVTVLKMADEENWAEQLKPILELKKTNRPGDIERAINRALNFVQAHQARMFIQRVVQKLAGFTEEDLHEYMMTEHHAKDGSTYRKLCTRPLADLASAMEKAHALTYMALNDSAQERVRRKEEDSSGSASDLHLKIAEAMGKVKSSNTPRALLFDAQLSMAQDVVVKSIVPPNPLDNDEH